MKFGIKCNVESNTEIDNTPIELIVDDIEYTLFPSEDGLVNALMVVTRVENKEDFFSTITPPARPGLAPQAITINVNEQIYNSLIETIQYIEATLSFMLGVKKIYWEEAEKVFIPETDEEQKQLDITSFAVSRQPYPENIERLTTDGFQEIIRQRNKYEALKIVKLFHREGIREFRSYRYIQAYYNFYFVLEDFYAQGKTNNAEVEKKFKASRIFRDIVQLLLNTVIKGVHLINIQKFLKEENKTFDIDGIIELVVQVRGNLHHYSGKSSKRTGTPLNQRDFESMAFLLMGISIHSIIQATPK